MPGTNTASEDWYIDGHTQQQPPKQKHIHDATLYISGWGGVDNVVPAVGLQTFGVAF